MNRLILVAATVLSGCGSAPTPPVQTPAAVLTIGQQTFSLDQLAPSPSDESGAHLEYAVIRVATSRGRYTVRSVSFVLVDVGGRLYRPVAAAVYVPIDNLDGLTIAPGHTGAGVVAFQLPSALPWAIVVTVGARHGVLRAP